MQSRFCRFNPSSSFFPDALRRLPIQGRTTTDRSFSFSIAFCRTTFFSLILIAIVASSHWLFFNHDSPPDLFLLSSSASGAAGGNVDDDVKECNLSRGRWVRTTNPPIYTNDSCGEEIIQENQNCAANGRPDPGYLQWRWVPAECEIPSFDPNLFLRLVKNRKMIFIGDSIARNHMQSLVCAIAQVERPTRIYRGMKGNEHIWKFPRHGLTVGNIWSPLLVEDNEEEATGIHRITVDKPDARWLSELRRRRYDIAVLSAAYWFFRPTVYLSDDGHFVGANSGAASALNLTTTTTIDALTLMQMVWATVFRHIVDEFDGIVFLRTVTVPHFDGVESNWANSSGCNRTEPDMNFELPWMSNEIYKVQKQELGKAVERAKLGDGVVLNGRSSMPISSEAGGFGEGGSTGRGKKVIDGGWSFDNWMRPRRRRPAGKAVLKLLDVTYMSLFRPDGHPNGYRLQHYEGPRKDCLHWCLPGPIDAWNQLLQALLTGSTSSTHHISFYNSNSSF